ncbi:MAG: hypothetical protein M3R05_04970 [Chloroflexota bacterium]|nr:hypothetical protein [Chloroflexota bacterium]
MPVGPLPAPVLVLAGLLLVGVGIGFLRTSGAQMGIGRRLGAAREVRVGDLVDAAELPIRPVRVAGRVRCADPLRTAEEERLVAFHRDVEVKLPRGGWRTIERLRETRSFELWDNGGSLPLDPAQAGEPLIVIPHVWNGSPEELQEPHRSAVERLSARGGRRPREARSTSRQLSVTDRLLVLAHAHRAEDGRVVLSPPAGGYLISALELDDAMRLLGGSHRPLLGLGVLGVALGAILLAAGLLAGVAGVLLH